MRRVCVVGFVAGVAPILFGCTTLFGPVERAPLAEPARPVRFDAVALAHDGMSVSVTFIGGREFSADDPCSVGYVGRAQIVEDELHIGIYALQHPAAPREGVVCVLIGFQRSVVITLEEPYLGIRIRDLAGYVTFLAPPPGLVAIAGLPPGWQLRHEESLQESETGRWSRFYSPIADPEGGDSWIQLIQAFDGPANTTGGDMQPDVMVNGARATFYLHAPSGEMVLVWQIGSDGVALVGNLRDFTQGQFRTLAESIVAN